MSFSLSTFVRVRPNSNKETDAFPYRDDWNLNRKVTPNASDSSSTTAPFSYGPFSAVIAPDDSQESACATLTKELVSAFLSGKNCTLFGYGQTGSGKTHTLFGPPGCFTDEANAHDYGFCPKAIGEIFSAKGNNLLFLSAVEVYLEEVYDLLNSKRKVILKGFSSGKKKVGGTFNNQPLSGKSRNASGKWVPPILNGKKNPAIHNLSQALVQAKEIEIKSESDILGVMRMIEVERSGRAHALNNRSSRSHCLVTLTSIGKGGKTQFLFTDLAGSERIKKTDMHDMGAIEAKNINLSLTALGRCMKALSKRRKTSGAFIPWRDSCLTMLMKQSLDGKNCRTAVCVCVAEDGRHVQETISSLRFAISCGRVATPSPHSHIINSSDNSNQNSVDVKQLHDDFRRCESELRDMQISAFHGHLDESFPKPTRQSFLDNFAKLKMAKKEMLTSKLGTNFMSGSNQRKVDEQITFLTALVIRQITTGVWREPNKSWLAKIEERQRLLQEMRYLGEGEEIRSFFDNELDDELSCTSIVDLKRDLKG